jgi:hypothetical protein
VVDIANRCVPARSSTTVKLRLLPLNDGIITLDTLQITAREKGNSFLCEKNQSAKKCALAARCRMPNCQNNVSPQTSRDLQF